MWGTMLFLVFINNLDIQAEFATIPKKFADDKKLGQIIRGDNDRKILQESLHKMVE